MAELFLAVASLLFSTQAPPAQEPKSDIPEKEAVEFARRIERDQAEGRETAFDALLDHDSMVEEASNGLDLTAKEKRDFLEGFKSASFGKAIGAAQGISYEFLRVRRVEGRQVLTFRVLGEGLNYHELQIKKSPDGIKITDLFIYMSGEWIGTSVRRGLMVIAASDPERSKKLPAWAAEWSRHMASLQEYFTEARGEQPQKALARFNGFPESIKKDRMIQTVRILAAARAGDEELTQAAAEYARLFPGDPCRDIVTLDVLIVRKEFGKCLEAVDRIDKAVGGDPALDIFRGRFHFLQDKHEAAKVLASKAVKGCPKLQEPHLLLIEISLKEKKYAETVERMTALETALKVAFTPEAIESGAVYADFIKSAEYREWKKSRAAK